MKNPDLLRDWIKRISIRYPNKPKDTASAVLFLTSPESNNITGQVVIVDDGVTALHSAYVRPDK